MTALISVLVIGLGAKRAKPIRRVPIWPMGNSRTESEQHLEPAEHSLSPAKVKSLIPKWVFTTGGDVSATLTVGGDLVYFRGGNLFSVKKNSGLGPSGTDELAIQVLMKETHARGQPSRPASTSRVSQKIESVAVLPFVTESGEPEIAFIGSQITTQVIDELSRISGIRVLAYSTVKDYKEQLANPQLVWKDLGVEGVVFGEFVRHNSDLFLHVELVDVADGTQLWGAHLKQDCKNLIDYSEQVAKVISRQLKLILSADQIKVSRIISKPSSSVSRRVSDNKSNSILFPVRKKA